MIFELCNYKQIKAFPINEYRYNLNVDESCFALRFVHDGIEYVINAFKYSKKARSRCKDLLSRYGLKTRIVKVTRTSDTDYEYRELPKGSAVHSFKQDPIDQFAIHGRRTKLYIPEGAERPDEFTVGPSYYIPENGEKLKGAPEISHSLECDHDLSDAQNKYLDLLFKNK